MILAILFLLGWFSFVAIFIITYITKAKLIKTLSRNHPQVTIDLGLSGYNPGNRLIGIKNFAISILSFGSYKYTRLFWRAFVDVDAIDNLNDNRPKILLNRLIKLTSWSIKIFIIMFCIPVIGNFI